MLRIALVCLLLITSMQSHAAEVPIEDLVQPAMEMSLAAQMAQLDPVERQAFLDSLSPEEARALVYQWRFWARPKQIAPPGAWDTWLLLAGRGFGKTRTAAEWVREEVEEGRAARVALLGATAADVRDTMVEGESGILAISPPWFRPTYEPSKRRLTWPNGAIATLFSADEPDRLRGPQHDLAWCDELAAWRYPGAWDQLSFGLRLGQHPRAAITTTPRPIPLIKELMKDPTSVITTGTTYENSSNLAPSFQRRVLAKYEGTRLGRQELNAEVLEDTPGALWTDKLLERNRIKVLPHLQRIIVAVDPSVAADGGGDEAGIIAAGIAPCSCKGVNELHAFVFDDLSGAFSPSEWGKVVVNAYTTHRADRVVAEVNNGGGLVEVNLRATDGGQHVSYKAVHASRGKRARAEPVSSLYEQQRVHHVGYLPKLESELTTWSSVTGEASPNRLDALVWGVTELLLDAPEPAAYEPLLVAGRMG